MPQDLLQSLCGYSRSMNRELRCISRALGRSPACSSVGPTASTCRICAWPRRRLRAWCAACIRIPRATGELSGDGRKRASMRFDAMCAVGVRAGAAGPRARTVHCLRMPGPRGACAPHGLISGKSGADADNWASKAVAGPNWRKAQPKTAGSQAGAASAQSLIRFSAWERAEPCAARLRRQPLNHLRRGLSGVMQKKPEDLPEEGIEWTARR